MAKARSKAATKKQATSKASSAQSKARKKKFGWGGRRPGAGRKPDPESGVSHRPRPLVRPKDFVLVTIRLASAYARMSPKVLDKVVAEASQLGNKPGFEIESHEVGKGLILLDIRARDRITLSRGIQGLGIRVTRALNRLRGTPGRAFSDRYDAMTFASAAERRQMARAVMSGGRLPHRSVKP